MKKIFMILSAALLLVGASLFTTSCKNGEDGVDGTSAEALILKQTGNKWYKYNSDSSAETSKVTSTSGDFGDIYLKYDTSSGKLIIAAVNTTLPVYAETSKELTSGKWAASAVALRVAGKITTQTSNPVSGKTPLPVGDVTSWGDFAIDALIAKLFE